MNPIRIIKIVPAIGIAWPGNSPNSHSGFLIGQQLPGERVN
jgi:hypothetical protein